MRAHRFARRAAGLMLLCLVLTGCASSGGTQRILLLTEKDTGFYWENLLSGAQMAAADNGWLLETMLLDAQDALEPQLEEALSRNADYLALATNPSLLPRDALADVPLIVLGAQDESLDAAVRVCGEDFIIGKRAGQLCAQRVGLQKDVILITTTERYSTDSDWENGVRGELGAHGSRLVGRINCQDDADIAYAQCRRLLEQYPDAYVICSSENGTLGALRAVRGLGFQTPIVGADFDDSIALGLRDGLVRFTVVRNAYAYGYMGVENAVRLRDGRDAEPLKELDAFYVDAQNMFDPEMQILLFDVD